MNENVAWASRPSATAKRLTATALSYFGLVAHLPHNVLETDGAAVSALVAAQHQFARVGRTDVLKTSAFFRLDLA